ncbi:MAG: hypothetical protein GY751_13415 [Bacteroidetes bacterium]|nr:hypothetical protein [Bacteroidota bacterium]
MKKAMILLIWTFWCSSLVAQDSVLIKMTNWLEENSISIRKTFDGTNAENKPATFEYFRNHKSSEGNFNIDLALKVKEWDFLHRKNTILLLYPKFEWHKSTDTTNRKNKIKLGANIEYYPAQLKQPAGRLPAHLENPGIAISPWFQINNSAKRNFIDDVFEYSLKAQLSFSSNYEFLPGGMVRDKKENFRFRYYPYFGYEYDIVPDLLTDGETEKLSKYFIRLYLETWIFPESLQILFEGTYRQLINGPSEIRTKLPLLIVSANLYPGNQEAIGIGYEYKHGYDPDSKFSLIQISSIKLNIKI